MNQRDTGTDAGTDAGTDEAKVDGFVGQPPAGDDSPHDFVSRDQRGGSPEEVGPRTERDGVPVTTPPDEMELGDEDLLADADAAGPES